MYDYKGDMDVALHALKDEVEGVREYKWMAENCEDPELKSMALAVMADEKKHATMFLQWINKHAAETLK